MLNFLSVLLGALIGAGSTLFARRRSAISQERSDRINHLSHALSDYLAAFCAYQQEQPIGFLYLKETGKATVELSVMGVLKEFHRQGIGKELFRQAREAALARGYLFMQVKTVQMGRYEDYDRTNLFYLSLGFQEFEVFPTLWDEWNPCQVYVMAL